MKRTVLFVDDEPNILMGLKRLLRHLREGRTGVRTLPVPPRFGR